jgi:hypothetical protein
MMQVIGYHVETADGEAGKVEDFAISAEQPEVDFLVVHTGNWLGGRMVKVPVRQVTEINWLDRVVRVRGARSEIENLPEYNSAD